MRWWAIHEGITGPVVVAGALAYVGGVLVSVSGLPVVAAVMGEADPRRALPLYGRSAGRPSPHATVTYAMPIKPSGWPTRRRPVPLPRPKPRRPRTPGPPSPPSPRRRSTIRGRTLRRPNDAAPAARDVAVAGRDGRPVHQVGCAAIRGPYGTDSAPAAGRRRA